MPFKFCGGKLSYNCDYCQVIMVLGGDATKLRNARERVPHAHIVCSDCFDRFKALNGSKDDPFGDDNN